MLNEDYDMWESDDGAQYGSEDDDATSRSGRVTDARQRYERLMEERRLKQLLKDDLAYW